VRTTRRRRNRRPIRKKGAALVEFALVFPVFILIIFTCIEFARLNMIRNMMQDAAYYAARVCIVPGATEAEAEAEANRFLNSMGTRDAQIIINDGEGLDENSSAVSVQIVVPLASNALLTSKFTGQLVLTTEATMRTERYDGFFDATQ
jgi:Flp pilus assembly protein TadG